MFSRIHLRSRERGLGLRDEVSLNSSPEYCRLFPAFRGVELGETLTLRPELVLGSVSPQVSAFLVLVLGWSCANEVGEELMCEQPSEARHDSSVSAAPEGDELPNGAPGGVGSFWRHSLGPPTRESSPESRAEALCLGKCVCSFLSCQKTWWLARRSAELQRGNVDVQLCSPAQGCLKTVWQGGSRRC